MSSDWLVVSWPVTVKWPSNDVKVKLYSWALLVKSLSVGTPEMTPVWASICRPGRHRSGEGQGVACSGSREVAGDVEREGVALGGGLVSDRSCSRAAVADLELEGLADCLTVGVGRCDRDRVVAEIAVGRHAGDDSGMGVDLKTVRHRSGEGEGVACSRRREVTGDVD